AALPVIQRWRPRGLGRALTFSFGLGLVAIPGSAAAAGDPEGADAASSGPRPAEWRGRITFSHTYGITAGGSVAPSLDLDFYFGSLARARGRRGRAWSFGYAPT